MENSWHEWVEEDLQARERQLSLVTDALPALISYVDKDEWYRFVNRRYEEFYGIPRDKIIGEHARNVIGVETYSRVLPYIKEILSGKRINTEVTLNHQYAGVRYIMVSYIPDMDGDGNVTGYYVFALDITERKEARDRLKREKGYTRKILDTAQVIILELDKEGKIVNFNPYMEEISGYTIGEVWGKDWFETFLPERERGKIREIFLEAIDDVKTRGNVSPIVTKDGQERFIEWYDCTVKDKEGKTVGLLSTGQDIIERRRVEEEVRSLARFPEENPNPVLRVKKNGIIIPEYA